MTKEEKLKAFIQTGFLNFAKICETAGVERTKASRWMNGERKISTAEVEALTTIAKQIRFK